MNRKEVFDHLATLNGQLEALLNTAEAENRSLTKDEQALFDKTYDEADMLHRRFKLISGADLGSLSAEEPPHKRFAEFVDRVASGKGIEQINLRAASDDVPNNLMQSAVVSDVTPVIYQDLLKPLEKGLIFSQLGCKMMYNVQGEPMWHSITSTEAKVLGEVDDVQTDALAFDKFTSKPKRMSHRFIVSRRAIHQSYYDMYGIILGELASGVARKLNHIMLDKQNHGEWSGAFVNIPTEQTQTRADATAITYEEIVGLEHLVLNTMTDNLSAASCYVMSYKTAEKLRVTPIVAGQSAMILEASFFDKDYPYGVMNGHKVMFSNYVPDGLIYFGDFRYLAVPQYGEINIVVDPYTLAGRNSVVFTLNVDMDMVRIRPEAFAVSKPKK